MRDIAAGFLAALSDAQAVTVMALEEVLDLHVYVDRLSPGLRTPVRAAELSFAWAGPAERGHGHYYRIQGPDLLIEYDNTQNAANHAHTVLRHPDSDFGAALLPAHLATGHR